MKKYKQLRVAQDYFLMQDHIPINKIREEIAKEVHRKSKKKEKAEGEEEEEEEKEEEEVAYRLLVAT